MKPVPRPVPPSTRAPLPHQPRARPAVPAVAAMQSPAKAGGPASPAVAQAYNGPLLRSPLQCIWIFALTMLLVCTAYSHAILSQLEHLSPPALRDPLVRMVASFNQSPMGITVAGGNDQVRNLLAALGDTIAPPASASAPMHMPPPNDAAKLADQAQPTVPAAASGPPESSALPAADSSTVTANLPDIGKPLVPNATLAGTGTVNGSSAMPVKDSMLLVGDSMMQGVAAMLTRRLRKAGMTAPIIDASRPSTGLTQLGYYDWPAHLQELLEQHHPSTVVILLGTNDRQDIRSDNVWQRFGSDNWTKLYDARTSRMLELTSAAGAKVYWLGLPMMRDTQFDDSVNHISTMQEKNALAHGQIFISTRSLFQNADGHYDAYYDYHGRKTLVRIQDGIHCTPRGYEMIADAFLEHYAIPVAESASGGVAASAAKPLADQAAGAVVSAPAIAASPAAVTDNNAASTALSTDAAKHHHHRRQVIDSESGNAAAASSIAPEPVTTPANPSAEQASSAPGA